ncbi:MAG: hypothetical protein FWF95_06660 [Syntrophorhabdaceae bacterium]|nr:hypothetical protein [Syntrophorhabdaceae bacterium]
MAIDKSKKYWRGDSADDVVEYLDEYSENEITKVVVVKCRRCGLVVFTFKIDTAEGVIEITCVACGKKHLLLDSEKSLAKSKPENAKCSECKKSQFNVAVGFIHRRDSEVKWVYIGNRCANCGILGSYGDWGINYAPTDEMEKNV